MSTVLASEYPGTGRPSQFRVLDDQDSYIEKLTQSFGYSVVATGKPDNYTIKDAWKEYTRIDSDGVTQWKKRGNKCQPDR